MYATHERHLTDDDKNSLDREIENKRIMNHTTLANYSLSSRPNQHSNPDESHCSKYIKIVWFPFYNFFVYVKVGSCAWYWT